MADNKYFYTETVAQTVPQNVPGTGNLVSDGTNTLATVDISNTIKPGDWVVSMVLGEVRRVKFVHNGGSTLELESKFSAAVDEALLIIGEASTQILYMELTAVGGDVLLNLNGNLRDGITAAFGKPNVAGSHRNFVIPKILNGAYPVDVNLEYWNSLTPEQL